MPAFEYRLSLIAQFPEDVYRQQEISSVLPQLMECLPVDKIVAIQFLKLGRVRLTFGDPATASDVLETVSCFRAHCFTCLLLTPDS